MPFRLPRRRWSSSKIEGEHLKGATIEDLACQPAGVPVEYD